MNTEARSIPGRGTVAAPVAKSMPKMLQLSPLGRQFAIYLGRLAPDADGAVTWAARLACQAVAEGQVCLDLAEYAGAAVGLGEDEAPVTLPGLKEWLAALEGSPLVGKPGDFAPLILERNRRLYLARYWHYERKVAERLAALAGSPGGTADRERLRRELDRLFAHNTETPDHQKLAAAVAVLKRFCVISGGPGTGKTSTVVRILAALQACAGKERLRIALGAPTGKAAARLKAAIGSQKETLDIPDQVLDGIPEDASTLHRLLGARPDSIHFRYNRDNPLPVDVLVVDEASMIDLALMAKLLDALPDHGRLILLGDKDQLAAVEPGSVFGDLCMATGYSADFCDELAGVCGVAARRGDLLVPPLADCVALLHHSHRFGADSGIGTLARLIVNNRPREAVKLLTGGRCSDLGFAAGGLRQGRALVERMMRGYGDFLAAVAKGAEPGDVLEAFDRFRVLAAHRDGSDGVAGINRLFEERLFAERGIRPGTRWYPGRPVMIARNDHDLRLFNGDIGVALGAGADLRVYFEDADGRIRALAPGRLPEHETVYAMTVHKCQGSEFDEIVLVLPTEESPVLNRPLLYTGLTRARKKAEILGSKAVLEAAIARMPDRRSGLAERLRDGS